MQFSATMTLGWPCDSVHLTECGASAGLKPSDPAAFGFVFVEASHHARSLMTLPERKDLEDKMTHGERGHGRSNKASDM